MYTLIAIFYISLLGMTAMVLFKRREVTTGQASFVSRAGAGIDHIFHAVFSNVRRGMSYMNRKNFFLVMHWIAFHVLKFVRGIYVEAKSKTLAHPTGKKLIDAVRGRGEVRDHGASFYLRRISADHGVK
jgi:hypothetical protein